MKDQAILSSLGKSRQASGKKSCIKVIGRSMVPTIKGGASILVRHIEPSELFLGDIAVFWTGKGMLVHRVIDIKQQEGIHHFTLKGDGVVKTEVLLGDFLLGKVDEIQFEGKKIGLEGKFWRSMNYLFGNFWRWNFIFSQYLGKLETLTLGKRKDPMRFSPSRLFLLGGAFFHQRFIRLIYLGLVR